MNFFSHVTNLFTFFLMHFTVPVFVAHTESLAICNSAREPHKLVAAFGQMCCARWLCCLLAYSSRWFAGHDLSTLWWHSQSHSQSHIRTTLSKITAKINNTKPRKGAGKPKLGGRVWKSIALAEWVSLG